MKRSITPAAAEDERKLREKLRKDHAEAWLKLEQEKEEDTGSALEVPLSLRLCTTPLTQLSFFTGAGEA